MKIRPLESELFNGKGGQTDICDEDKSLFVIWRTPPKNSNT
jgi:hypothetical protein